ncbi:MAG: ketopantoate reductase family protein [Chloroflexi bacterium]|nr:ketopantoate reductase family protein [Chloroflexota bacterium]
MPIENNKKRIIFIGAGAVGSYLGGWLSHTGHDVTIVDMWNDQVETIRQKGLRVEGPHEPFVAHPSMFHLHENELLAREPRFDIGFVAVKAYDTAWAATFINKFVKAEGYVVSSQNTWTDPAIAAAVGVDRAVGLVMSSISVALWEAGKVERPGDTRRRDHGHLVFRAGNHDGSDTPRLHELIDILDPIDGGKITTNLWGERWAKLSQNSMGNPVTASSGMGMSDLNKHPRGRELQIRLAQECAAVGLALGHDVENFGGRAAKEWADAARGDVYETLDGELAEKSSGANWRPSMAQDVVKGRPTEIYQMNGFVCEQGKAVGIDTPVNAAILNVIRAIDAGELEAKFDNVELTLTAAGY